MSEIRTEEAVAQSGIEADVTSEHQTANKWEFDCHVDGTGCHAMTGGWTKLWKECVNRNEDTYVYSCPGQGCTEKLKLVNDSHGAHVRLKRLVIADGNRWDLKDADGKKWEHAYVVIPTCSKCNTSYNDLTRKCTAVKVANFIDEKDGDVRVDKKGRVRVRVDSYVGSITQDGHTVHKLTNVKLKKLSAKDKKDVEGSVGLKHLTDKQLEVLKENLKKWLGDKGLDTDHPGAISLFSEVRILFSRLMVSRRLGQSDILKLKKPQKIDLLMDEAFGKHSGLSRLVVWDLNKKLMEICFKERGAFKLFGTKNPPAVQTDVRRTRSQSAKAKHVTLNFDNDATDEFFWKLVTTPRPSKPKSQEELEEWEEWKNRAKSLEEWKNTTRENIVLEVPGTEQYPETTASEFIIEHLKEILKDVVDKQSALKKVKEYCEIELRKSCLRSVSLS
jgi:hypothetical protein